MPDTSALDLGTPGGGGGDGSDGSNAGRASPNSHVAAAARRSGAPPTSVPHTQRRSARLPPRRPCRPPRAPWPGCTDDGRNAAQYANQDATRAASRDLAPQGAALQRGRAHVAGGRGPAPATTCQALLPPGVRPAHFHGRAACGRAERRHREGGVARGRASRDRPVARTSTPSRVAVTACLSGSGGGVSRTSSPVSGDQRPATATPPK